jgi:hypothetical protein
MKKYPFSPQIARQQADEYKLPAGTEGMDFVQRQAYYE